jgi:hypothetical protein
VKSNGDEASLFVAGHSELETCLRDFCIHTLYCRFHLNTL